MNDFSRRRVRIAAATCIADRVRLLRLVDVTGGDLPVWHLGAHVDVVLPSGTVRQYSLCGLPEDRAYYDIAVLRETGGRGGSQEIHDDLDVDSEVDIVGPRNRFPLLSSSRYLFIAGGIGITPILPMVEEVARRGCDWRLVYGGRSLSSMAFLDRLEAWPGHVQVSPEDEQGLLDLERYLAPDPDALVYCCGPEPLLTAVTELCGRGWPPDRLHVERFGTAEGTRLSGVRGRAFDVQLGPDGPTHRVAEDESILAVLRAAGVDVLSSCEEGTCGSCETRVLEGDPDHRDELLSPEERADRRMLICVSRTVGSRLVLDLSGR